MLLENFNRKEHLQHHAVLLAAARLSCVALSVNISKTVADTAEVTIID